MASTFETVADIIADTCDIERDKITPESHAINDLGIDSLDLLDITFAIDEAFQSSFVIGIARHRRRVSGG